MAGQIVVFNSTHQALKTEDVFRAGEIEFEVVPLPKEFSADCGLAIEFGEKDLEKVKSMLESSNISIKGIFPVKKS